MRAANWVFMGGRQPSLKRYVRACSPLTSRQTNTVQPRFPLLQPSKFEFTIPPSTVRPLLTDIDKSAHATSLFTPRVKSPLSGTLFLQVAHEPNLRSSGPSPSRSRPPET